MKVSELDKVKHLISEMMNKEHDEHAQLLSDIRKRTSKSELLDTLTIVYDTRIQLLEYIFNRLKAIK